MRSWSAQLPETPTAPPYARREAVGAAAAGPHEKGDEELKRGKKERDDEATGTARTTVACALISVTDSAIVVIATSIIATWAMMHVIKVRTATSGARKGHTTSGPGRPLVLVGVPYVRDLARATRPAALMGVWRSH
jgi:hypothetical protein